jgi:hypothetical protein
MQSGAGCVGTSAKWRDADARKIRLNRNFQRLMDEQARRVFLRGLFWLRAA